MSALLAAGALLAAAADSLGGPTQRPVLHNAALTMPSALNATAVSALLAARGEHAAESGLADPGARPDPAGLYNRHDSHATGGPVRPSPALSDPASVPSAEDSPQPLERTRRATKPKSKSGSKSGNGSKSKSGSRSKSSSKSSSKTRSSSRSKSGSRSRAKAPVRHQGSTHSRSTSRSRSAPTRHTNSYLLSHLPPPKSKKAAAAVHEALSLIGVPYRWGGTTRAGFDCSGFTQHVWAAAGVKIPRTVRAQARAGTHIPLSKAEPGDLVVFYPSQHHVGIYIGNGLVIDSPHTGASVRPDPVRSMPVSTVVRVKA